MTQGLHAIVAPFDVLTACWRGRGVSDTRTSTGTWAYGTDSSAMARLEKRIEAASGLPASHGEVCLANVLAIRDFVPEAVN